MSAHFDVKQIQFFALEQWPVTVCAWRGCCIEVFARAEHSVAECLATISEAGLSLSKDADHQGAAARMRALDECLARYTFAGHEKAARKRIAEWGRIHDNRAGLAHGRIKATGDGITINHRTFGLKGGPASFTSNFSRMDMLAMLAELEQAQRLLHSHLGQIKAHVSQAKPLPTP
jgi:hypothetical protein